MKLKSKNTGNVFDGKVISTFHGSFDVILSNGMKVTADSNLGEIYLVKNINNLFEVVEDEKMVYSNFLEVVERKKMASKKDEEAKKERFLYQNENKDDWR